MSSFRLSEKRTREAGGQTWCEEFFGECDGSLPEMLVEDLVRPFEEGLEPCTGGYWYRRIPWGDFPIVKITARLEVYREEEAANLAAELLNLQSFRHLTLEYAAHVMKELDETDLMDPEKKAFAPYLGSTLRSHIPVCMPKPAGKAEETLEKVINKEVNEILKDLKTWNISLDAMAEKRKEIQQQTRSGQPDLQPRWQLSGAFLEAYYTFRERYPRGFDSCAREWEKATGRKVWLKRQIEGAFAIAELHSEEFWGAHVRKYFAYPVPSEELMIQELRSQPAETLRAEEIPDGRTSVFRVNYKEGTLPEEELMKLVRRHFGLPEPLPPPSNPYPEALDENLWKACNSGWEEEVSQFCSTYSLPAGALAAYLKDFKETAEEALGILAHKSREEAECWLELAFTRADQYLGSWYRKPSRYGDGPIQDLGYYEAKGRTGCLFRLQRVLKEFSP